MLHGTYREWAFIGIRAVPKIKETMISFYVSTSGSRSANPYGAPEFTPVFCTFVLLNLEFSMQCCRSLFADFHLTGVHSLEINKIYVVYLINKIITYTLY